MNSSSAVSANSSLNIPNLSRCWPSPTYSVFPKPTTRNSAWRWRDSHTVGNLDHDPAAINPLQFLDEKFSFYIEDRRREPRGDVLSDLAGAKYPDGSTPEIVDVVRTATFLFGAGQETTAKLLGAALQILCDRLDLQQTLRDDRSLIPAFIEETLRMESPVKSAFRLARKSTCLGGVDIPAGTVVMVSPGAINRDPNRFENPHEFRLDRPNVREQIAFARGCTPARVRRWRGSRAGSRWNAFWTGWATSGRTKPNTGPSVTAATVTRRPSSCAVSMSCTSKSLQPSRW
jgi:hypothetical protein